jgi:predicted HicB family RNase H-like nuclease
MAHAKSIKKYDGNLDICIEIDLIEELFAFCSAHGMSLDTVVEKAIENYIYQ